MKHLTIILSCFLATAQAQTTFQRPVQCYDVKPFIDTMKEHKLQIRFTYDTEHGTMAHADNGSSFIVFEYVKSISKFCIYAEVERV